MAVPSSGVEAGVPLSKDDACQVLRKRVSEVDDLPVSGPVGVGWFCDFSTLGRNRWYVVALRSHRACDGKCSNLMGWYAVSRQTGAVHNYDIAELKVGSELAKQ